MLEIRFVVSCVNREIKVEIFQHFPRTASLKTSRDQSVGVRLAV